VWKRPGVVELILFRCMSVRWKFVACAFFFGDIGGFWGVCRGGVLVQWVKWGRLRVFPFGDDWRGNGFGFCGNMVPLAGKTRVRNRGGRVKYRVAFGRQKFRTYGLSAAHSSWAAMDCQLNCPLRSFEVGLHG